MSPMQNTSNINFPNTFCTWTTYLIQLVPLKAVLSKGSGAETPAHIQRRLTIIYVKKLTEKTTKVNTFINMLPRSGVNNK